MPKKASKPKARRKSNKGSPFERDIARKLSLWLSSGVADDWFWRTAGSGGRATNRAKQGKATANGGGDICAQTKEAQELLNLVTFELKRGYNTATVSDLLDIEGGGVMGKFIAQAKKSASLSGTPFWAVIHKRDRREALVITNMRDLLQLPNIAPLVIVSPGIEEPIYTARLDECLTPVVAETIKKGYFGEAKDGCVL